MTRVDFYILPDQDVNAAERFACRLCLKAINTGMAVHVRVKDVQAAEALDQLMWDYPKHRFLPHEVIRTEAVQSQTPEAGLSTNEEPRLPPIHIGWAEPVNDTGLLINLSDDIPSYFGRFDRVAEIIVEEVKEKRREHYKFYQTRGYPLHHHQLQDWEN